MAVNKNENNNMNFILLELSSTLLCYFGGLK